MMSSDNKESVRKRLWYQTISKEKRESVKQRMRDYYAKNKEAFTRRQRERRAKIRLGKAANKPDS
jgi:hypothetical protein